MYVLVYLLSTPYHQEEKRPAEMQGISQPHH